MKFEISNLGYIKQAEIELGDLTIICGKNNTGKTYVNYAIYGFLTTWLSRIDFNIEENEIEKLFQTGFLIIDLSEYTEKFIKSMSKVSQWYSELLPIIFEVNKKLFTEASFLAKLDDFDPSYLGIELRKQLGGFYSNQPIVKVKKDPEKKILEVIMSGQKKDDIIFYDNVKEFINEAIGLFFAGQYCLRTFIITSERTGVSLFYKELDLKKNNIMTQMMNKKLTDQKFDFDFFGMLDYKIAVYSKPVQDEINFVRNLDTISHQTGELAENNPEIMDLLIDIIGGDYNVTDYSMSFKFTEDNKPQEIPLYSASSTVKSLMNLYFYLKHLAKPGDILIIDEPELNLHPENQRKLAKLFTRLTKCGLKLLMTTHSDYLIKELNNLIILKNDFERKSELMQEYKYSEEDMLEPDKVRVYIAENNTLNPAKITPLGIEVPTFDDEIINMTDFYDEVYYEVIDNIDI